MATQNGNIKFTCTACDGLIQHYSNARRHPVFQTLVCGPCHLVHSRVGDLSTYRGGVDIKGAENYCRLCLDGGDLILCKDEKCRHAFCNACVLRNFGQDKLKQIKESDSWYCYVCDYRQFDPLRASANKAFEVLKPNKVKPIELPKSFKIFTSSKLFSKPKPLPTEKPANVPKGTPKEKEPKEPIAEPVKVTNDKPIEEVNDKELNNKQESKPDDKINDKPSDKPSEISNDRPAEIQGGDSPMIVDDLENELMLSDDSSSDLEEFQEALSSPPKENPWLGFAVRDAKLLQRRLQVLVDSLNESCKDYDEGRFKRDPNAMRGWLGNIHFFLNQSSTIQDRCNHIETFLTTSGN